MKLTSKFFSVSLVAFLLVSIVVAGIVFTESQGTSGTNGVDIATASSESTYFYVDRPEVKDVMPGENFKINISIAEAPPTYAWSFGLNWDPNLLELVEIWDPYEKKWVGVMEGDFLDRRYWDPDWGEWVYNYTTTFIYVPLDEANLEGKILISCSLQGDLPEEEWASGDGWLATLNFLVEAEGSSVLNLYKTRLADHLEGDPPYPAETYYPNLDGFFFNESFHDIAIINVTAHSTLIWAGETVAINVTVANEGNYSETFDVAVYADTIVYNTTVDWWPDEIVVGDEITVGTQTITEPLAPDANTSLTFTWNTTGVEDGTYTISANATLTSPTDDDTRDNLFIDGTVTVTTPGTPLASFTYSPEHPIVGDTVTFNASDSKDLDGWLVSYTWDFGDNTPPITVENVTGTTYWLITHPYTSAGSYTVNLTVTDNEGLSGFILKAIPIAKMSSTISITASPTSVTVGESVTLSGSITPTRAQVTVTIHYRISGEETWSVLETVTTDDNSQYTYHWTTETAGTYEIKASWEGDTNTEPAESDLTTVVVKAPPIASFTHTPSAPVVGDTVTFTSTSTDPEGSIVSWDWNFGDGTADSGEIVTHTYATAGDFIVNLTVTDNDGLTNTEEKEITIGKLSSTISIFVYPENITLGESTTINGTISPTRQDANVMIQYRTSGETEWNTLSTEKTDSTGFYEYTWTPETAGTYEVKAKWPGDENTLAAESDIKTVTVEEISAPTYGIQLYVLAAVIIIAAAILIYILKIK